MNGKWTLVAILLIGLFGMVKVSHPQNTDAIEKANDAAYHIAQLTSVEEHLCSATAIGPQALLTATHCELGSDELFVQGKNGKPIQDLFVTKRIRDNNDHTIMFINGGSFPSYVDVEVDYDFTLGQDVFVIGNPANFTDLLRKGYISGVGQTDISIPGAPDDQFDSVPFLEVYMDIRVGEGDSGAAVFNERGKVIGVVTGIDKGGSKEVGNEYRMPYTMHLMFTEKQLKEAAAFKSPDSVVSEENK